MEIAGPACFPPAHPTRFPKSKLSIITAGLDISIGQPFEPLLTKCLHQLLVHIFIQIQMYTHVYVIVYICTYV